MKKNGLLSLILLCSIVMAGCNNTKKETTVSSVPQSDTSHIEETTANTTKSNEPLELFMMDTFQGNPDYKTGPIDDTYGNHFNHMYLIKTNSGDRKFSYQLNGEFQSLKGTIIWSKEYKNDSTGWYTLSFYDGDTRLYTTQKCEVTNSPVEFSFDVSGVRILTIEFEGFSNDGPFEWGSLITVQKEK